MKREERKAAVAAYKEQKTIAGIYAVRCAASGQIWIGQAPNLATIQNRLWFTLRHGSDPHRDLQEAWTKNGGDSFSFEELERLADEELPHIRSATLKERQAHWRTKLNAETI
jgi:hypothetical protein